MFPTDLAKIIAVYSFEYNLLPWIDEGKINWVMLSGNPNAIDLIKANPDKINWKLLSSNPNIFVLTSNLGWNQLK